MIKAETIEQIKSVADIVDVIGSHIELKKAGVNFKACCPFHDEKTPSFVVNPVKQIYHWFGCHAGGDVIRFMMDYEKISYPEALEKLALRYHITIEHDTQILEKPKPLILEVFNTQYRKNLTHTPLATEYLASRHIHDASIEKFQLGWAKQAHEEITFVKEFLLDPQESLRLGMLGEDNGRYYPRFHERLMFPIYASSGMLIAFGGRTLSQHPAKYLNSPQTELFNKSRVLYAYHLAKESIFRKKELIVTEGYLDVIMLHQAGFTHTVATLGTALTKEHLPLLRRGEPRIIIAYDGDEAGKNAALKASRLLASHGLEGGVVLFEGGLDPADMVAQGKINELNTLFHHPKPFVPFVLETIASRFNLTIPEAKQKALDEITPFLAELSPLLQEEYSRFCASLLDISPSFITKNVTKKAHLPHVTQEPKKDFAELALIKTAIDNPLALSFICDFLTRSMLIYHAHEFELLQHGNDDSPYLREISIDEQIKPYQFPDELREQIIIFLTLYHQKELKRIKNDTTLSYTYKTFWINHHQNVLVDLRKGRLDSSLNTQYNEG